MLSFSFATQHLPSSLLHEITDFHTFGLVKIVRDTFQLSFHHKLTNLDALHDSHFFATAKTPTIYVNALMTWIMPNSPSIGTSYASLSILKKFWRKY